MLIIIWTLKAKSLLPSLYKREEFPLFGKEGLGEIFIPIKSGSIMDSLVIGKEKGFSYILTKGQIDEYRSWPIERRLKWLYFANKLRRYLPKKTIGIQEAFREGKI